MSDFTINLSNQVQQKSDLKSAFVTALSNAVNSPLFTGQEINDLYQRTLEDLKNELQKKSNKCSDALSSSVNLDDRIGGVTFLQENDFPTMYSTSNNDILTF